MTQEKQQYVSVQFILQHQIPTIISHNTYHVESNLAKMLLSIHLVLIKQDQHSSPRKHNATLSMKNSCIIEPYYLSSQVNSNY